LQLQFLTRIANVQYKADNNTLLLAYTGYLRLKAITTITLQTTTNNTTSDSDYNFDKNNTIEILFSFGNCSFNKNNVNPSTGT
jgi:hypothetical protein